MKYLIYRVACSKPRGSAPRIHGIGTLALNVAEGSGRSSADLAYCVDTPARMVEWFAQQTGALGDRLVGWQPDRAMATVLSVALDHGIDFGHVFQRHQDAVGERHMDLCGWVRARCHGTTLQQQRQGLKIKIPTDLAQGLVMDCFVMAALWIKIQVVMGILDIRGRKSMVDLMGSAFRCSDVSTPAMLRQIEVASNILTR